MSIKIDLHQPTDDNESISDSIESPPKNLLGVVYGIGMNVNEQIGSGIVTAPGIVLKAVKSPGTVLLLWFVGGIIAMSGSLSYVELGIQQSIISRGSGGSGGETKYLQNAYPKPRDMISFLFSFMFIL